MVTEVSQQYIKRRKTSDEGKATETASASVPAFGSLPPELLDTICSFLDVRTLCTARLVCKQLRKAASRFLHSVEISVQDLRSRPETNLNNFSDLARVRICGVGNRDLVMLARSPVADGVTHLRAIQYVRQLRHGHIAPLAHLLPFPNLVSLAVMKPANSALLFPPTLRELILDAPVTYGTAILLTRLTNLTCLQIHVNDVRKPFEAVTALTGLQRLDICCEFSLIPLVAQLTLLTHLQVRHRYMLGDRVRSAMASLQCLQRLVHLGFRYLSESSEPELITGIGAITSLRSLDLGFCGRIGRLAFGTVCMTPVSQLTALQLSGSVDASFLSRLSLKRLQHLSLSYGMEVEGVGIAAWRRATGLTCLHLWTQTVGASVGIGLERMSRLCALSFHTTAPSASAVCSDAIRLLTGLTRLEWGGRGVTRNSAMAACLGLKKLRVLKLSMCGSSGALFSIREYFTPETFFAVAMLPELSIFHVCMMVRILGWDLKEFVDDTSARIKADRQVKGWPPLVMTVDRH